MELVVASTHQLIPNGCCTGLDKRAVSVASDPSATDPEGPSSVRVAVSSSVISTGTLLPSR